LLLVAPLWFWSITRAQIFFFSALSAEKKIYFSSANPASLAKPAIGGQAGGEKHALNYPHSKAGTISIAEGLREQLNDGFVMETKNEIKVERQGDVTFFNVTGDVTRYSKPFFTDAYGQAGAQRTKKILIKFDEKAYFNSEGLKVMIQFLAETNKKQQQVVIVGLSDHFKKIFNMVGITKFAKLHTTQEEALKALEGRKEQ
jgi:anti-anti-sigma factor